MAEFELDPITVEVIHHGLLAAADEMKACLQRTAHSPIINDMLDFSVALFNEHGETVAQAPGLPSFLCDMPSAIHSIAADIGGFERFEPGDLYLTNDPYLNTNHTNDVNCILPIFSSNILVGFAGARAHWHDIGAAAGGGGNNFTEVFQEGLILRSIRLYDRGRMNDDVMRIIRENNRLPEAVLGDIEAQIGACRIGEQRLLEIIRKYGRARVEATIQQIFSNGEAQVREAMATLLQGEYSSEACLDHDGVELDKPLVVRATVRVLEGRLEIDLAGSSDRCVGPFNSNRNTTTSICRMIFKMLTTPKEPANEGHFRALTVRIPEGSIFDAKKPSATMLGFFPHKTLEDVIKAALAPALPERVNAHDYGKCTPVHIKGWSGDKYFILPDTEGGGWGATQTNDGVSALLYGDVRVVPIEVLESKYPVLLQQYALRQDSCGAGRQRGGFGIVKDYQMLVDVKLNAALDRQICPPQGVLGGKSAQSNRLMIKDGQRHTTLPSKVTDYPVKKGEVISIQTGGGGGYGPPGERSLQAIANDLAEGLITPEHATSNYSVTIDSDSVIKREEERLTVLSGFRPLDIQ